MAVALNDKLTGTINLKLADGTFFSADCQLTVTGAGNVPTQAEEEAAAKAASEAAAAKGATGATGAHAGATGATGAHQGAAGHHEARK